MDEQFMGGGDERATSENPLQAKFAELLFHAVG
jgi:hypothetical protein